MPNIRFEQVTKRFGQVEVLPPLDLTLNDNEFTVLVGPSGCGKSTTLRIVAGLEGLSGGEIYFDQSPISHLAPKDRDLAMVFQDYALYPHMNIAKNMSFALRLKRAPKREINKKVGEVAEMLNISHLLNRKPAELSGGQRQRVAMGRALVRDSSTFLFDEPLSNLDAKLRAKLRNELAEMRGRLDKNMIYVTHDQVEAMTLGDRIVVMSEGIIQQQGSPEELYERPTNRFVASFIGSPTMNFLDGSLGSKDGRTVVAGKGFALPLPDDLAARAASLNAADVVLGLRPSSFDLEPHDGRAIDLDVVVAEYLGAHTILVTRCAGQEVQVELNGTPPPPAGTTMTFGVEPKGMMLFDHNGTRL